MPCYYFRLLLLPDRNGRKLVDDWNGTTRGSFRHLSLLSPLLYPAELLRSPFHSAQAKGIRGNQEQIRHEPCEGACEADGEESEFRHKTEAHDAPCHHFKHACEDREEAIPHTLNAEAEHVDAQKEQVCRAVDAQEGLRICKDLRLPGIEEEKRHVLSEEGEERAGKHRIDRAEQQGAHQPLMNPFGFFRADVLSRPCCHRSAQRVKGAGKEQVDLSACGHGRDCGRAEFIDRRLQDHAADCGNGILQPHGNARRKQCSDVADVGAPFAFLHMQNSEFLFHIDEAEHARDRL